MTKDFNADFTPQNGKTNNASSSQNEHGIEPSIYDSDFSPATMLRASYTLRYYSTLCVKAPAEAARYEWKITAVNGEGFDAASPATYTLGESQQLNLYVPKTALRAWTEYTLSLTVYSDEGDIYTDTATLWVVPAN